MNFLYKFNAKDNLVIYIGRTKNLKQRIYSHINKGHLPKECYDSIESIEYVQLSAIDVDLLELFLIDKYRPKYNKLSKYEGESNTIFDLDKDLQWIKLDYKSLLNLKNKVYFDEFEV